MTTEPPKPDPDTQPMPTTPSADTALPPAAENPPPAARAATAGTAPTAEHSAAAGPPPAGHDQPRYAPDGPRSPGAWHWKRRKGRLLWLAVGALLASCLIGCAGVAIGYGLGRMDHDRGPGRYLDDGRQDRWEQRKGPGGDRFERRDRFERGPRRDSDQRVRPGRPAPPSAPPSPPTAPTPPR